MGTADELPPLQAPRVRFAPGFAARCERFAARVAARRARRDEFDGAARASGGHEFAGYRPYVPGDDPRAIDAAAWARSDDPLVRVTRREAGARRGVVIDTSASMGVGPPGKLQFAAEVAAALALAARARGETTCVVAAGGDGGRDRGPARATIAGPRTRPAELFAHLESLDARGVFGAAELAAGVAQTGACARVVVITDALSLRPADVVALAGPRRRVALLVVLAPHEMGRLDRLERDADGAWRVEWVEPERGARVPLFVDEGARRRYEAALGLELETWRVACARARVAHDVRASDAEFEEAAERCLVS